MNVIIAGGRDFNDVAHMQSVLDLYLSPSDTVITGGAKDADSLAHSLCKDTHETIVMQADWNKHGKRAGYIRNQAMANVADTLIAFWDGNSKGTKHMIDIMEAQGKKVIISLYI